VESYFTALSKRQMMLLLTAVTFGGQDASEAFSFLPEEEGELLKERAAQLHEIPREKRVPLLVQEIKRLVTARRAQLWATDPARLAELLSQERTAMIEMVVRALPANLGEQVRRRLPRPKIKLRREVKPEVLNVIRARLEQMLTRAQENRPVFKFSDILLLQSRELVTVCDRIGARRLVRAVAGLPEEERTAFLEALSADQRQPMVRLLETLDANPLPEDGARERLALWGADQNPSQGMRKSGVARLARACLAQSAEFAARVVERHRNELGQILALALREERRDPPQGDGGRADVVRELERMERRGLIDRPLRLAPPKPSARGPSGAPQRGETSGRSDRSVSGSGRLRGPTGGSG
jgi:hypothetical protein